MSVTQTPARFWTYCVPTGSFYDPDGNLLGYMFYSGHGAGLNNPAMSAVPNVGPVPPGFYHLGMPFTHPQLGRYVMRLIALPGTDMQGRSSICYHGDTSQDVATGQKLASEGCIVGALAGREAVWNSGVHFVRVVDSTDEIPMQHAEAA